MISILLPSRGRPNNLRRLLQSIQDTADIPVEIEVIVRLDSDDSSYYEYGDITEDFNVYLFPGPRTVLSRCWNECFQVSTGDILMHCGDDIVFRTAGWDTIVKQTFDEYSDKIVFVYGNDGLQGREFGTHGFIHRKWVEAVGYFVPPYFVSDFNDTWLNEVAKLIGRHRWIDIYTEHLHFINNKAEIDQTHRDRIERHERENPAALYETLFSERVRDAGKLQQVMEN